MHTLIVGITESGKTTILKRLVEKHLKNFEVIVLTSIFDAWPQGSHVFDDPDKFLQTFWASKKCIAIIDEGSVTIGRYNEAMEKTATQGRHWGHSCYFAVQRASQISPNIRAMCSQLFCFSQGQKDSDILSEEFNQPLLQNASSLKKGEFFLVRRFGDDGGQYIEKMNAFEFENKGEMREK